MTKFETMDNMNTNFVALSDQELIEMEGGVIPLAVWAIWGAAAGAGFAGGIAVGLNNINRGK